MSTLPRPPKPADSAQRAATAATADAPKPAASSKAWRHLVWTSAVVSACTTTRVQTAPVPEQLRTGRQAEVRLSLRSGEVVTMFTPAVIGDSIIGFARPASTQPSPRLAVARADVQSVAATELSVGKTIAASVVGGLASLTLLVAACVSSAT